MNEAAVGIVVGIAVAVAAQVLSSLAELILERRKEKRQAKGVRDLLRHEVSQHLGHYRRLLAWAEASIERGGKDHTEYSYERVRTHAYNQVFLVHWYLLLDPVIRSVIEYYALVQTVNVLGGSFDTPTPVPIAQAKAAIERAQREAEKLVRLLEGG